MWKLTKVPQPAITIFGGSRLPKESKYSKQAFELAKKLTQEGFSVITGGGAGIMEAANQGAYEVAKEHGIKNNLHKPKLTTVGISLTSFKGEGTNPYVQDAIYMDHFFSRKWLMVRYSIGFIVFPGGFGTLDEFFEIVTLEQCYRMPKMPIILMGKGYWSPMVNWMHNRALKHGLIEKEDLDLIHITSNVNEALEVIEKYCKGRSVVKHPLYAR